ncbi:molybdopterin-guanine dinucleotide biosynthesis protein B [Paenibacillus sp. JCM 10914]|uniref:molybdopterin-guanine dinucleotide biosynthesis protein B n=1 Tax=Paenibacillus sp. JCM 10914 TaxID=1236974 RepID=UPI001E2954A5|nr:molybdopterin-guanine dinucleotide biosynthesis protein B [Paenibacillus sp. JCM 10914]
MCGYKNSGKTTLISSLLPMLKARGIRTGVIKHDGHSFDMDHPGTDTYRFREAGAASIAITSAARTAIIREEGSELGDLLEGLDSMDLILVEGFKQQQYPKLVMLRKLQDLALLNELVDVRGIVVTRELCNKPAQLLEVQKKLPVPVYAWDDVEQIMRWIVASMERD